MPYSTIAPRPAGPRSGGAGLMILGAIVVALLLGGGCAVGRYNALAGQDEGVDAAFTEIDNQYKRRNDLISQIVQAIKGSASFEKDVLIQVTEARASVGKMQAPSDPGAQANYLKAQKELGGALSRLLVVSERYPDLKTTSGFRDLQTQIEGNENRIAVARRDYIDSIKAYNTTLRKFPGNIIGGMFGFEKRPQLEAATEAEREVPTIDFSSGE